MKLLKKQEDDFMIVAKKKPQGKKGAAAVEPAPTAPKVGNSHVQCCALLLHLHCHHSTCRQGREGSRSRAVADNGAEEELPHMPAALGVWGCRAIAAVAGQQVQACRRRLHGCSTQPVFLFPFPFLDPAGSRASQEEAEPHVRDPEDVHAVWAGGATVDCGAAHHH